MASTSRSPSVSLISLGCSKNQVDSETILSRFLERGFRLVDEPGQADLAVINTCGFIGPAKEESIETILDMIDIKKGRPEMKVMVAGCLYQRYPQIEGELAEVDYWLTEPNALQAEGTVLKVMSDMGMDRFRGPGEPEMYQRKVLLSEPGSAFVRISQGCDRTCSFCAIPGIKGGLTSRAVESLVREVVALSTKHKVHEINLVAQDLTSFGTDRGKNEFLALLKALDEIESVRWFRLHYVYPFGLNKAMLEFLAQSKRFARYIDMPFQHGDDTMLKVMRRGGSMRGNLEYIRQVREAIPGLALRTTILVGHPRETEGRFENLLSFLNDAAFEWLGVFPYSPEENTHSHSLKGRIPKQVQDDRVQQVMEVYRAARGLDAFRLGQMKDALVVEDDGGDDLVLRSETEAPEVDGLIRAPRVAGVKVGQLVKLRLLEDDDLDFRGEIVPEPS